ncbi:MAG: metal ABC transporter permease [Planctomycetes bacterium]|nr:metal ABC transporter permease [Planctomycetota bacterium]MCA8946924.1 metal ABC transporter permease [Planctomycetota bacterium]
MIDSWYLFWPGWVSAWLIAGLLPLVGIPLLARRQVFLGVTVAQTAGLGVVLALSIGAALATTPEVQELPRRTEPATNAADPLDAFMREEGIEPETPLPETAYQHSHQPAWAESNWFRLIAAMALALIAAVATGCCRGDAVLGWLFVGASAGSVLLAAQSPHGMQEVERLLGSTLITATPGDAVLLSALSCAAVVGWVALRRQLLLWTLEPVVASAFGMRPRLTGTGYYAFAGIALGASMYASGLTYTFAALLLPLLAANNLVRRIRTLLILAPVVGVTTSLFATLVAHQYDLPPGPVFALLAAGLAMLTVPVRHFRA